MKRRQQRGFTLLEVMVALAIFSTTAAAFLSATHYLIWQYDTLSERSLAAWIADNELNLRRLGAAPSAAITQQLAFGGRQWQVATTVDEADAGLQKVTVQVTLAAAQRTMVEAISLMETAR